MSDANQEQKPATTETQKFVTQNDLEKTIQSALETFLPKKEEAFKEKDVIDETKKEIEAKKDEETKQKELESAIQFTISVQDLIKEAEEAKDLYPEEFVGVLKKIDEDKHDSRLDKANAMREAIIKCYFSVEKNFDYITDSFKNKIKDWLGRTKETRMSISKDAYDIFLQAVKNHKDFLKHEEIKKGGETAENSSVVRKHHDKIFALGDYYRQGIK